MTAILRSNRFKTALNEACIPLLLLLISGVILTPLHNTAWHEIKSKQVIFDFSKIETPLSQGLIMGICGGFRNIVADLAWLNVDKHWRKRESAATEAWIHTTLHIDPRPKFFWTNAARILALDMPAWEIQANGGWTQVPKVAQEKIIHSHAVKGINILDTALEYYPNDHDFLTDKGRIYYQRLGDIEKAAACYLEASKIQNSPHIIKEIYANLLIEMNKKDEAYEHLKSILPMTPEIFLPDLQAWIAELEEELAR